MAGEEVLGEWLNKTSDFSMPAIFPLIQVWVNTDYFIYHGNEGYLILKSTLFNPIPEPAWPFFVAIPEQMNGGASSATFARCLENMFGRWVGSFLECILFWNNVPPPDSHKIASEDAKDLWRFM